MMSSMIEQDNEATSQGGATAATTSAAAAAAVAAERTYSNDLQSSKNGPKDLGPPKLLSYRYALVWWGTLGFINLYFQRVNLSVAMVAMVNHTLANGNQSHNDDNNNNVSESCPFPVKNNQTNQDEEGEFNWDQKTQSTLLGAFFYGYLVMQVPGGMMAAKFGGKWLFGLGTLCTSVFSLLMPLAARAGWQWMLAFRIIQGIGEGVTTPAMSSLLGQWAPPPERSMMATVTYGGTQMGTILGLPLAGLLCKATFLGGWSSVFYIYGTLGIIWFACWTAFCFDDPDSHPRISAGERQYINTSLGKGTRPAIPPTPWRHIFTSVPVWALIWTHACFNWTFYTLLTETPSYLADILHFDIAENGFISALPYLMEWIIIVLGGMVADHLRRQYLSTRIVRRLFNSAGMFCQLLCLLGLAYVGCDRNLAVFLLIGATGFSGLSISGYMSNHLDIAPDYSGVLMGLSNCAGTIPGFMGPLMVGSFTTPHPTISGWQSCFFISAAIGGAGMVVFAAFAAGEIQPWATTTTTTTTTTSTKDGEEGGEEEEEEEEEETARLLVNADMKNHNQTRNKLDRYGTVDS